MIIREEALLTPERYKGYKVYSRGHLDTDQESYIRGWMDAVNFTFGRTDPIKPTLLKKDAVTKSAKRRQRIYNHALKCVVGS